MEENSRVWKGTYIVSDARGTKVGIHPGVVSAGNWYVSNLPIYIQSLHPNPNDVMKISRLGLGSVKPMPW